MYDFGSICIIINAQEKRDSTVKLLKKRRNLYVVYTELIYKQ